MFQVLNVDKNVASQVVQLTARSSAAVSKSRRHSCHQTPLCRMVSNRVSVCCMLVWQ